MLQLSKKNKRKEPFLTSDKKFAFSVAAVALLLFGAIIFFAKTDDTELVNAPQDAPPSEPIVFDTKAQSTIGDENAPIEVVEFFDFQCPHCQNWSADVYPGLKEKFIDTGKVQFSSINFAFLGLESELSALMFETINGTVNSEKAFMFKEKIMELAKKEDKKAFNKENLLLTAKNVLEADEFAKVEKSFDDKEFKDSVSADKNVAVESDVQGTPSIFINGVYFEAGMDPTSLYEELERLSNEQK
jgi:protein-disulfide isomerase